MVDSYAYFKIPLETFVTDSQYMDHDQDFTISPDFEPFGVSTFCPILRCRCLLSQSFAHALPDLCVSPHLSRCSNSDSGAWTIHIRACGQAWTCLGWLAF